MAAGTTYSSLVDTIITPPSDKYNEGREGNDITKITVHCQVGLGSPESCTSGWISSNREVSANYIIGPDGKIGGYVAEEDRSWCSDSRWNDNRAITIEVASESYAPYEFPEAAYNRLILLCADICTRYNFKLYFTGDESGSLTGHYMFSPSTEDPENRCPGGWFRSRYQEFCDAVNKKVESGVFAPDDYDDSYEPVEEPPVYDYYLITSTSKQNQPGECGNKITGSVYLGRW